MRAFAAAVAAAAAAALAGTAHSAAPLIPGGRPIAVYASMAPRVALFGDPIHLEVTVLADRRQVDPKTVRVEARLQPYVLSTRRASRREIGNVTQFRFSVTLTCIQQPCLAVARERNFFFKRGRVSYELKAHRGAQHVIRFRVPILLVLSRINTTALQKLLALSPGQRVPPYYHHLLPIPRPSYRIAPATLAGVSSGAAAILFAAGLLLFRRYARARRPVVVQGPTVFVPPLEQALAFLRLAQAEGDEVLVRKALERVATELESDGGGDGLAEAAHELAWAETEPPATEVEQLVQRAEQEETE